MDQQRSYLVKEGKFCEVTLRGKEVTIRNGVVGKNGRMLKPVLCNTVAQAQQCFRRQLNLKRMIGFAEPEKVKVSRPLKKRLTLRRNALIAATKQDSSTKWRKPHRKQSTIRRLQKFQSASKPVALSKQTTKQLPALVHAPSLTAGADGIYLPPKKDWRVTIPSPVIWKWDRPVFMQQAEAFALHVDDDRVLYGDDQGIAVEFDGAGSLQRAHGPLPSVRCILRDGRSVYVGCTNGTVYGLLDLMGPTPRHVYTMPLAVDEYVTAMTLSRGILVVAGSRGALVAMDHDGLVRWMHQTFQISRWMLQSDADAIYCGSQGGITAYELLNGSIIWHRQLGVQCHVFAGQLSGDFLYVSHGEALEKINRVTSHTELTYPEHKGDPHSSLTLGSGFLFAADKNIVTVFNESTGEVIYHIQHTSTLNNIQYNQGRLFVVTMNGLEVLDLSASAMKAASQGTNTAPTAVTILKKQLSTMPRLEKIASISEKSAKKEKGVVVECVKDEKSAKLRVVPVTKTGFLKKKLSCQFPMELKREGCKYIVDQLDTNAKEDFFHVSGNIKLIE